MSGTDDGTQGRWLTYDELAEVRGIQRIGAVRLAKRQKWRRQPGNDGKVRVMVPPEALAMVRGTRHRQSGNGRAPEGEVNGGVNGALTEAAAFTAALAAIGAAHAGEVAALMGRLADAQAQGQAAQEAAKAAQQEADQLRQAEAERKLRGLVDRLRAAWRGE